jgi:hypothetical protein
VTPQTRATCRAHLIVGLAQITERGIPDTQEEKDELAAESLAILRALHELADEKVWCKACLSTGPHPDPDYHHPYCSYRRDGRACSCVEGKGGWDRCGHEPTAFPDWMAEPEHALEAWNLEGR